MINWVSSDNEIISEGGIYGKPYIDKSVALTATITYGDETLVVTYNITAKRYYSDLSDGVTMGYMYFSNSSASDNTYQNVDIIIFAHATAGEDGSISNLGTMANYFPSRITRAHSYGTYCLLSFSTSNLSVIAADSTLRATFANKIVEAINTYNFDGVDIDWEFPKSSEATNFTLLMKDIYEAVKANNQYHLVTTATGIDTYTRYDLENAINYLDYVNIMTYDMHNSSIATHQAALYYKKGHCYKAISNANTYYVTNLNLPKDKLILGIPFYGRKFTDTEGISTAATMSGALSYATILSDYLSNSNYIQYWDEDCQVPYLYNPTDKIFITYDNPTSIDIKCKYAKDNGYAGIMYWQDAQDSQDILFDAIIQGMNYYKNQ